MLPKVANHLIQHTSRAVAAVQNSAFRNVLQLQSSPNTITNWNGAPSSSGWGGSGAGAGGAKFHSSSRFNGNYSSLGRGISLADPSVSSGSKGELADDSEDFQLATIESHPASKRSKQRARRGSLTFTIQDTVSTGRVLKALRQHVRATHSSSRQQQQVALESSGQLNALTASEEPHHSDLAHKIITQLETFFVRRNWVLVIEQVKLIYGPDVVLSTELFNVAFKALLYSRPKHESIRPILDLYNYMISSSIAPNSHIYWSVINTLLNQDRECARSIELRKNALSLLEGDAEELKRLQDEITILEDNRSFPLALTMFQATCETESLHQPNGIYTRFLSACADNSRLDIARLIVKQCSKRHFVPGTSGWKDYILLQAQVGDFDGAIQSFATFREECKRGHCKETGVEGFNVEKFTSFAAVWGEMLYVYVRHGRSDEALALLEEMLDSDSDEIPHPSAATFSRIIAGFGESGDVQSALAWFDRLLQQSQPCVDPNQSSPEPTKPAPSAWAAILQALNVHDMHTDLDRLLALAKEKAFYTPDAFLISSILSRRISFLQSNPEIPAEEGIAKLDFLVSVLFREASTLPDFVDTKVPATLCHKLVRQYCLYGHPDRALQVAIDTFVNPLFSCVEDNTIRNLAPQLQYMIDGIVDLLASNPGQNWSLLHAARLAHLSSLVNKVPSDLASAHLLSVYIRATSAEKDTLGAEGWETLFQAYVKAPEETRMTLTPLDVFQDGIARGVRIAELREKTVQSIVDFLQATYRGPQRLAIAAQLGISDLLRNSEVETQSASDREGSRTPVSSATAPSSPTTGYTTPPLTTTLNIDEGLSRELTRLARFSTDGSLEPYNVFEANLRNGIYPTPAALGRVINYVGRLGHVDKVKVLYEAAQKVLEAMADNKSAQSMGWFQIEDQMIIALAHAGDVDAAHVHRQRILAQKGFPSSDAYGILIQNIKDTTDDNTNALALFYEAMDGNVLPNVYLFNIVISKLARARKADSALELFHSMKMRKLAPTSVTYGALIAACGRVGDVVSAENLFTEMASQSNFRPRIPPYNMMMQLYTQTKPDRERVLYYYNALLKANIKPTAHTYKLLMEAYGTVEPADINGMETVFEQLLADRNVVVNGAHWAVLIHAYGCVQKDLDKAVSVFESIKDHPSTKRSGASLPDAIAFEALINVFNTLRRPDLIPHYVAKLPEYRIHMTAYIANLLIRGYAMNGDIERSRAVFDSLVDPPEGVAAPNNHAPHDSEQAVSVPVDAPVFREPSTWEAMVRAELGNGNRDKAVELLERVKARRFPVAVYNRISGIMLDESVAPWESRSETASA